jgi:hypothetical protein
MVPDMKEKTAIVTTSQPPQSSSAARVGSVRGRLAGQHKPGDQGEQGRGEEPGDLGAEGDAEHAEQAG